MATLKLKKPDSPAPRPDRNGAEPPRQPARGHSAGVQKRPTLAQAQAQREEHEARYQEQRRLRHGERGDAPAGRDRRLAAAPPAPSRARANGPRPDPRSINTAFGAPAMRQATAMPERRDDSPPRRRDDARPGPPQAQDHPQRAPLRGGAPDASQRASAPTAAWSQRHPEWQPNEQRERPREARPAPASTRSSERSGQRSDRTDPQPAQRNDRIDARPPQRNEGYETRPAQRSERSVERPGLRSERPDTRPAQRNDRFGPRPPQRNERPDAPPEQRHERHDTRPAQRSERPAAPPRGALARARAVRPRPDAESAEHFPGSVRLSKRMSELGMASRREADEWIPKGWVRVDGQVVSELGSRVVPGQRITIDAQARHQQAQRVTVLLNKPMGYVSGQAEDGYEPAFVLVTPQNQWREDQSGTRFLREHLKSLVPAGRLDIDSVGLLVLTQDGRIAKQLIGEDTEVEKEYLVRVEIPGGGSLPDFSLALLNHGLELDGEPLRPARVEWVNEHQLRFALRQGKKRQIRRMCEAVGLKVVGLKRVRIGALMLGDLPVGQWRYLRADEAFVAPPVTPAAAPAASSGD